jgi:phosphatidylethanolamine-binding protein (PEBP) family uncharacterized protein
MNLRSASASIAFTLIAGALALAHETQGARAHPHFAWSEELQRVVQAPSPAFELAQLDAPRPRAADAARAPRPAQVEAFAAFATRVQARWDERFVYIESNGLPEHNMMVGITNWQQHVPLPQPYTGENAWRIPLHPVPAREPVSIKGRFLRGAIAIAVNGIPIFNPQNNRGEVSAEIGELDQWGGHCGRADDYHYHAAPLHLQDKAGAGKPIAYALDGYAIYGLTEPDGSAPAGLDAFDGHTTGALGYHYHASKKYPYVNGGFHGEVVEREGQVDPQPRGAPIRGAMQPLRGAKIVGFEAAGTDAHKLSYTLNGETRAVLYNLKPDGSYQFVFQNGRDGTLEETFTRRGGGGGPRANAEPPQKRAPAPAPAPPPAAPTAPTGFVLRSAEVADGGALPVEYSGDGAGATPPLAWTGAPAGTKSFALIMHHLDPQGVTKWYWTLYNIPGSVTELPKNVRGVGTLGSNSVGRQIGYLPPHSKGPGAKTYVLTLYALSDSLAIELPPAQITRETLLAAMKGKVLGSAELHVVYTRVQSPPAR